MLLVQRFGSVQHNVYFTSVAKVWTIARSLNDIHRNVFGLICHTEANGLQFVIENASHLFIGEVFEDKG